MGKKLKKKFKAGDRVVAKCGSIGTVIHEQEIVITDRVWVRFHDSGYEIPIYVDTLKKQA